MATSHTTTIESADRCGWAAVATYDARIVPSELCQWQNVGRGGNVAIQIHRSAAADEVEIVFTISDHIHDGVVSVVGTFNDWTPGVDVFTLRPDGTRVATLRVSPAQDIRFRYLGSEGVWFDDTDADDIDEQGCVLHLTSDRRPDRS